MIDPREITIRRTADGRWSSAGPNGRERNYAGEAARVLEEMFNKPEGSKR